MKGRKERGKRIKETRILEEGKKRGDRKKENCGNAISCMVIINCGSAMFPSTLLLMKRGF